MLVFGHNPSEKHLLCDCKLKVIDILLTYKPNSDFFIINKKYRWLYYFKKGKDYNIKKLVVAEEEIDEEKVKETLKAFL